MKAFDINSLTLGEVATVERIGQAAITSFGQDGQPQGDLLTGLALVIKSRQDPSYTLAQAKLVTLTEALALVQGDEDESEGADEDGPKDSNNSKPNDDAI